MEKTVNDAYILRDKAIKRWAAEKFVNSSNVIVPAEQIAKMEAFVGNKDSLGLFYVHGLLY